MLEPERIPKQGQPATLDRSFRAFWDTRTAVNQSIAALTFSQRLTRYEVSVLRPHLKSRLLRDIYPAHVAGTNFNYRLSDAVRHLERADDFLFDAGFIACQPAYETYLDAVVHQLCEALAVDPPGAQLGIPGRHRWIGQQGVDLASPQLELFDVLREARNAHVHAAGEVNDRLAAARSALSPEGETLWESVSDMPLPPMDEGHRVAPGSFDPIAAIAAIGNLGIELNRRVQASGVLTLERWADIAVLDWRRARPDRWGNTAARASRALRHARLNFGAALPHLVADAAAVSAAVRRAPANAVLPA